MVQVPTAMVLSAPEDVIVQTDDVVEVKTTARPEVEVAISVVDPPKFCGPGLAKVMVWTLAGVMGFDGADAVPVPALFVALTEKV
jgi:hypothetical protein